MWGIPDGILEGKNSMKKLDKKTTEKLTVVKSGVDKAGLAVTAVSAILAVTVGFFGSNNEKSEEDNTPKKHWWNRKKEENKNEN